MLSDERERRIGANEVLFREVNERLDDVNNALSNFSGVMQIVCECGEIECAQQLTIPTVEYEHLRSDATWFAVIPGHEIASVEMVVTRHDGYDVVRKRPGTPMEQAEATDPRH